MDDFAPGELFQHKLKSKRQSGDGAEQVDRCNAPMCDPCLRRTAEHHRQIKCPGCRQDANPCIEFVALNEIGKSKPKLRSLCLPVVFRLDNMEACDNNRKFITLFGHPGLVNVPNQVTGRQLNQLLRHLMPPGLSSQVSLDYYINSIYTICNVRQSKRGKGFSVGEFWPIFWPYQLTIFSGIFKLKANNGMNILP